MAKIISSIVVTIIGYILIIIIREYKFSKEQKTIANEKEYRDFCNKAGYIYMPNKTIRRTVLGAGYKYIQPSTELKLSKPYINIGHALGEGSIIESIQVLSKMPNFDYITLYQTYGDAEHYLSGLAYPGITADIVQNFQDISNDIEFFNWLKTQKPYIVDGKTFLPINPDTINSISIPIQNFGLDVIDDLPTHRIEELLFGQGTISILDLENALSRFPNVKTLYLNYIDVTGEDQEIMDLLVNYANNSKLEKMNLLIYQDFDVEQFASKTSRDIDVKYTNANE